MAVSEDALEGSPHVCQNVRLQLIQVHLNQHNVSFKETRKILLPLAASLLTIWESDKYSEWEVIVILSFKIV